MVSVTVPGFMLTVIWLWLTMIGAAPGFRVPLLGGTVHSNCTVSPLWKLVPLIVRVWLTPFAVIVVGEIELTVGAVLINEREKTGPSSTCKSIPWFGDTPSVTPPHVC
jgi:hypothetical protein